MGVHHGERTTERHGSPFKEFKFGGRHLTRQLTGAGELLADVVGAGDIYG